MGEYMLKPDEFIIMEETNVTNADGDKIRLVLTDRCLLAITYNIWGKVSDSKRYALIKMKELKGEPNIITTKESGRSWLTLCYPNGQVSFHFENIFTEKKWNTAIVKAYKDRVAVKKKEAREEEKRSRSETGGGLGKLFAPAAGLIDSAKNSYSSLVSKPKTGLRIRCPYCGAELSGVKGETVECEYCGHKTVLK